MQLRSQVHLKGARHFGLALFSGFTGTRPTHEEDGVSADRIAALVAPEDGPQVIEDKARGLYFVPCPLKVAPYVGKTLERAIERGLPTTGKMRSAVHVTAGAWIKLDVDGVTAKQFAAMPAKLDSAGLAYIIYPSHSNGREDKPGIRCRVIIFFDRTLESADYQRAVLALSTWLLGESLDPSEARLCQQAGVWAVHPDRLEKAFCIRKMDGYCVSADALLAMAPKVEKRTARLYAINSGPVMFDAERINAALTWFDPNLRNDWLERAAFFLKAAWGESALPLWVGWSQNASEANRADPEECERRWVGVTPRIEPAVGASALFAGARDEVVAVIRKAADAGTWDERAKAALVYLRRFHPKKYDDMFEGRTS